MPSAWVSYRTLKALTSAKILRLNESNYYLSAHAQLYVVANNVKLSGSVQRQDTASKLINKSTIS